VDIRAGMDVLEKWEITHLCLKSNHDSSDVVLIA
jgi:hypothetical protein